MVIYNLEITQRIDMLGIQSQTDLPSIISLPLSLLSLLQPCWPHGSPLNTLPLQCPCDVGLSNQTLLPSEIYWLIPLPLSSFCSDLTFSMSPTLTTLFNPAFNAYSCFLFPERWRVLRCATQIPFWTEELFPLSLVESVVADGPQLSDFSGSLALG